MKNYTIKICLALMIIISISGIYPFKDKPALQINDKIIYADVSKLPSVQELYTAAKPCLGKFAKLFIVIKVKETGNDGNYAKVLIENNNLTGMKMPGQRFTYAIGKTSTSYCIYENWFESMLDFKIYMLKEEGKFRKKKKKNFENEQQMINHMYGSYNTHIEWKISLENMLQNFNWK